MKKVLPRYSGITILELLITVAILGVISALAVPSLIDTVDRMASKSAARTLAGAFSLARSEAVKRGKSVNICPTSDGVDCDAASWSGGWIVFVDENGDADGDTGSIDSGDSIVRVFEPFSKMYLSVSPATDLIVYDNQGYGVNSAILTFTICPFSGNDEYAKEIEVSLSGRARIEGEGVNCS